MPEKDSAEIKVIQDAVQDIVNKWNVEREDPPAVLINCVLALEAVDHEGTYETQYIVVTPGTSPATSLGLLDLTAEEIRRHILD